MLTRGSAATLVGLTLAAALIAAQAPVSGRPGDPHLAGTQTQAQLPSPAEPVPPATFKMEINYIDVSVRVLDEHGSFVPNLKQADFRIVEDRKPQTINAFGLVQIPLDRPEKPLFMAQPIDPDVVTNARGNDGRLYVLVLDDLHTDPLRSQRVKNAARKFIEEDLGAGDLAAVTLIGRSDAAQELTGNRRFLLAAVDKFLGQQPQSATLTKIEEYNRTVGMGALDPGGDVSDPYLSERLLNARRSLRSLSRLADWMSGVHGRRKALIYFSEGFGYDISDVFRSLDGATQPAKPDVSEIFDNTRDVIAAATRSDVNIYAVDPRGLSAAGDELIAAGSLADAGLPLNAADASFGNNSTTFRSDLGARSLNRELETAHDNLRMLSEETGGFATLNSNDFAAAFKRIVDENSSYYILGYYSNNEKRDGKYRSIDVRVVNRPGLVVHARKGYLAPHGKTQTSAVATDEAPDVSAQLRDLLRSPVPVRGMMLSATAATFKGTPPNETVVVTVEVSARDLRLTSKDGKFSGKLAVALVVVDGDGKLRASAAPTLALGLRAETYNQIVQGGNVRIVAQFALPPGRYQLRAAGLAAEAKASGDVQYDLEVPDFTKARVSLSSVALVSPRASRSPTVADNHLDERLPEPTALREFSSNDELALYVEAYDNQPAPAHKIDITSTVRASDGHVVFTNEQERSSEEIQPTRGVSTPIPLKALSPGLYVLTVEARSTLGNPSPVTQLLQFRIR
jgi:VWFA-related protein